MEPRALFTPQVLALVAEHTKYLVNLPLWKQYVVWRYTMGSATLNNYLLGRLNDANPQLWTLYFFSYYNYKLYGEDNIGKRYKHLTSYFRNPEHYWKLDAGSQDEITQYILKNFAEELNSIILNAPETQEDITVFKSSTPYDDLPGANDAVYDRGVAVNQRIFNSTTYDSELNFRKFLGAKCCLFELSIPKGSRVLAIAPTLHGYPHEHEILLPFSTKRDPCSFLISESKKITINLPLDTEGELVAVQEEPFVIGEAYRESNRVCKGFGDVKTTLYTGVLSQQPIDGLQASDLV